MKMPVVMLIALTFCAASVAQPAPQDGGPSRALPRSGVAALGERLAALRPSEPMGYFNLAEEVAYEYTAEPPRRLARTLYILAFETDRRLRETAAAPSHPALGPSAALALADLSPDADERRWLRSLAHAMGGPADTPPPPATSQAPRDLALALNRFRAGDARGVREQLLRQGRPGAGRDLLLASGLPAADVDELIAEIAASAPGAACPRCRNERFVRGKPGDAEAIELCPVCKGNPGPGLRADRLASTLRAEGLLIGLRPQSWAAQTFLDGGRPLRDADPDDLAAAFGVDPLATVWKPGAGDWTTGSWSRPDGAEGAPAAP
ncbi:MAG: hypothetical protein IBJ11_08990 [Phycisphaerales bacterium]|nr:hypothetical protein [Phycisphaerales bacterium]